MTCSRPKMVRPEQVNPLEISDRLQEGLRYHDLPLVLDMALGDCSPAINSVHGALLDSMEDGYIAETNVDTSGLRNG